MAHPIVVDFNTLPRNLRERIVDCTGPTPRFPPVLAARGVAPAPVIGWAFFALLPILPCALGAWAAAESSDSAAGLGFLLGFWAFVFFFLALCFRLVFNTVQRGALPFAPGQYLFTTHFVDATSRMLRVVPLDDLTGIDQEDVYYKGVYVSTNCRFSFSQGPLQSFDVRDKAGVEAGLREFHRVRALYERALQQQDTETLRKHNLFFDVPGNDFESLPRPASEPSKPGLLARDLPWALQKRWQVAFGLSLLVFPCAALLKLALNAADDSRFQEAQRLGTVKAYVDYTARGGRHLAEARELGAQVNYQECEKTNTGRCWRLFLLHWSDSTLGPQVRAERLPRAALQEASGSIAELESFLAVYPGSVVDAEARARLAALQGEARPEKQASGTQP